MVSQYEKQLDNLMRREVSRGDFLKFMGIALLGVIGVTGFFKNLQKAMLPEAAGKNRSVAAGYGRSAYGR